jgi:phage terminase large subunit-like protein
VATRGWPPRWLSPDRGRNTDGDEIVTFVENYCRITKDSVAGNVGDLLVLRGWQKQLLRSLYRVRPDGRRKHRTALVGIARKNGKSALSSGLALHGLFLGPEGGEVYSCAADKDQARIVFAAAKRMVELDPELSGMVKPYRDALEVPSIGAVYRALSAEAYTKEGLNPHLVLFDEVHAQPDDELWNVMQLAFGARANPLMLGITTAGSRTDRFGEDSLCFRLYQHGKRVASGEIDDPSFFFAWWEPKKGDKADHALPVTWLEANPGLQDKPPLLDEEDFAAALIRTRESEFRTKRCNQWVVSDEAALPHGAWDACENLSVRPEGPWVVIVDGSWNGDSTAMVAVDTKTLAIRVEGLWERPLEDRHWRVPIADVMQACRDVCRRLKVVELDMDPYRWQQAMQELEEERLPIVEFPNTLPRMVPAWQTFFDAVMDKSLSHDGDPRLARHVENMRLKIDAKGARPVKEHKTSQRHIDLGICAVIGVDRATAYRGRKTPDWSAGWK